MAIKKPILVCKKVKGDQESQNCSICLETYKRDEFLVELDCHHFFHAWCLTEWLNDEFNCPYCRREIRIIKKVHDNINQNNYDFN